MKMIRMAMLIFVLMQGVSALADHAEPGHADLSVAKHLIEAGKPAEAYAALAPFEFEMAGNPDFDYLLAVSALDSGQPEKAILIFDRVLAVNPQFAGARMDLARAYFMLQSDTNAREQFETVLSENPPELVKKTAQQFIQAIDDRSKVKPNAWTAYAEVGFGYDSNVNASTNQGQIAVPALGNIVFNLSPNNIETSSEYLSLAGGGEFTHTVNPKLKLFVGADVRKRNNPEASAFHNGTIAGHVGLRYGENENNVTVSLQRSRFYLGGDPNRDTTGVSGQWQYTINPRYQFSLFGTYNQNRYQSTVLQSEDINQEIIGAGWLYAFDPEGKTLGSASIYVGHESAVNQRVDGDKALRGARLAAQHNLVNDVVLFGSLGVQNGEYQSENVAFLKTREDWLYDASIGVNWKVSDQWSIRPQVSYSKNSSNIVIDDYNRTDASVIVRWDFR